MDNLVKQRVVGAVVLVALAVIFIPILLEGPGEDKGPRSLELPQSLEELREGRIEPMEPVLVVPPDPVTTVVIGEDGASTVPDSPPAEPRDSTPVEAETGPEIRAAPSDEAVVEAAPEPLPEATPSTPEPESVPASGWVVQVGAFGQEANALGLRDRLRGAGHTAFVERVMVDGKAVYRVRVGPYVERASAEARLAEVARDSGLQARVMPHP